MKPAADAESAKRAHEMEAMGSCAVREGANSVVGGDRVRTVISHQADKKELIRYFVTSLLSEPDDQLTKYRMSFWLLDG